MIPGVKVIKVGGSILEKKEYFELFLEQFVSIPGPKVLVHGGGRLATQLADRMGVTTQMVNGRRITDDAMIDLVTMTYGGSINKTLVTRLQAHDVNALGLTGADGNLIKSDIRPVVEGIDYGWVGDPTFVNIEFLLTLLNAAIVPVIAPLTHDGNGHILNTNADTMANEIGATLASNSSTELIYVFELSGVLKERSDPDSLIENLDWDQYQNLKQAGIISEGMIPKLDNAFNALKSGVSSVKIIKYDELGKINKSDHHGYTTLKR